MKKTLIVAATALSTLGSSAALAQSGAMPMQGNLPTACQSASAGTKGMDMKGMDMTSMQQGMQGMDEVHKAYMQAMLGMHQPMMTGMMASDADVAFVCGMIPHHQGAIAMARVQLKYGDDPQVKKMAEKTIKEQEEEIKEMTSWVEKHAKK